MCNFNLKKRRLIGQTKIKDCLTIILILVFVNTDTLLHFFVVQCFFYEMLK